MPEPSAMIPTLRHVLAARRMDAGYSLRDVAAHSRVGYSQLSRWENGQGTTDVDAVVDGYAATLHVSARELWAETWRTYTRDPGAVVAAVALRGRRAVQAG